MTTSQTGAPGGRVVVGVDGSAGGTAALEWAAQEAGRMHALLEIHAASGPGYVLSSANDVKKLLQGIVDTAAARANQLAPDVAVKGVVHEGSATSSLVEASRGADLLVVGSRGRGGFSGLLLGSVSQQCSVHAHCPVVIVRKVES